MEGNNNNDDNIEEDFIPENNDLFLEDDPSDPLNIMMTNSTPDPELLQHPIFQSINDPFLSIILQPLKAFISADPNSQLNYQEIINQFKTSIHKNIFGTREIPDLHDQFEQLGLLAKQVCGKILVKGEIYFRCLDCDDHSNPALISILCAPCFEHSNHDGHRIIVIKKDSNSSAACDCGDANEMNSAGFCPNHQNKQIDLETLLKLFPTTIFQATQNTLKKAIYSIISLYELKQKTSHQSIEQLVKLLADLLLEELLKFCQTCYTHISGSFLFIFLKILQEQFLPTMNKVWHDCEDFTNEFSYNEIAAEQSFTCKCSLLGNLFKIGNSISLEAQVVLQKILVESSTELKFKEFIMLEFTKYLHYFYSQDYTNDEDDEAINSRLLNMQIQLYGREEFLHKVIDAGYHKNFIEVMRRAVHGTLEVNYELYYILSDIRSALSYFMNLKYSTAKRFITQTDFMKDLFEILMNFQIKFSYPGTIHIGLYEHLVDYRSLNRGLMVEKVICLILENGLRVLNKNLPADQKSTFTKSTISEWYVNFSLARDILAEDRRNGAVSFHIGLERIFCAVLRGSLLEENFTKPAIEDFIKQSLPDVDPQNLAEMILDGTWRTMGMIRYLTLVHNYNAGELWYVYYFFNNSFFEIDTVTAQLMTMLIKPEKLFQDMVQSYFSYSPELINFFVHPNNLKTQEDYLKQKISVLQDFLQYLIFLMNDEICLLNLDIKDRLTAFEPFPNDNRYKRVVEKVCINLLLGHYWTDLSTIKGDLEGVLRDQQQIDNIVMKITVLDEKTHKIRLKDEYQTELDPYIFYRKPSLQQEILNNIPNKSKNQDLISGQYYKNLPQYLKTIQKTLYQSSLPDFLTLFLDNYNEHTASLVRPVLKLILMNLQVAQEYRHLENDRLLQLVNKNYLTPKFMETLKNLLADSDLKDCKPCIVKIQAIINTLSIHSQEPSATSMIIESVEDEKKRLAREKMEKLKAQFSQKQALFADVNKKLLADNPDLEETKTDVLTCQYCLEKIDKAREQYGIPIYITFTNNLFDTQDETPFKEMDYNSLDQANWWPIISSCNHDYHQKCFEKHFANTRKPDDTASRYFNDKFETYCSLCKTLCNDFLCIIDDEFPILPKNPVEIFSEMTKRLASILPQNDDLIEQEPDQVHPLDIFQRAYAYFLETFHLHNQPKILEKNLNLYKHFFYAFQSPFFDENYSFLTEIVRTVKESSQDPLQYDPQPLINRAMAQRIIPSQILKDYLAFRITQAVGFHAPNNLLTIKHCLPYYQGNKSLQENLTTDLIFPLQKIALSHFLNTLEPPLSSTQLADLICSPSQVAEDYLNRLLQACGISTPLNKFIEDIFTEDLPNHEKAHLDLLNSMLLPKTISPGSQRPTISVKMAPRVLTLPSNYMEFNNTYYRKKCGSCNEYSRDLLTVVCLICGEMVCQVSCEKTKVSTGNLNRHAAKYHMGTGLFLDLVELNKSLVNAPLNTINTMKETYIDNFGQAVQDILSTHHELGKLDFKQFGLNQEFVNETEELIKNNSVSKELFRISLKATHYYEAGYL